MGRVVERGRVEERRRNGAGKRETKWEGNKEVKEKRNKGQFSRPLL